MSYHQLKFERGERDALARLPPSEASEDYIRGYEAGRATRAAERFYGWNLPPYGDRPSV
jgi:hypothetical protein